MFKIAVTGAAGFIGHHVCNELKGRGYDVRGITRGHKNPDSTLVACDLLQTSKLRRILKGSTTVVHLAAKVPEIGANENFEESYRDNVEATESLIKASVDAGVKKIVYISGWHIYQQHAKSPIKEDGPLDPMTVYAKTKSMGENLILKEKRIKSTILRVGNVYGPRPSQGGVILNMIKCASSRNRINIESPGRARDYLYVEDVAKAVADAAESTVVGIFNIGSGKPTTIKEIANTIIGAYNKLGLNCKKPRISKKNSRDIRYLDTTKARKHMAFKPRISLREGLAKTIVWWETQLKPEALVFDVDGTILDVRERYYGGYRSAAQKMGFKLPAKKTVLKLKRSGLSGRDVFSALYNTKQNTLFHLDKLRLLDTNTKNKMVLDAPFPGTTSTLKFIRSSGLKVVFLTKRPPKFNYQLRKMGILHKGDMIINVKQRGGKTNGYKKAIKKLQTTPYRCVALGDSPEDIAAARSLGMMTIAVLYGLIGRNRLLKEAPNISLRRISDLKTIIRRW